MLITKSNMEYQETMNYWKQIAQLMKYFRTEEDSRSHVPRDFMTGFLEVGIVGIDEEGESSALIGRIGSQQLEWGKMSQGWFSGTGLWSCISLSTVEWNAPVLIPVALHPHKPTKRRLVTQILYKEKNAADHASVSISPSAPSSWPSCACACACGTGPPG
jgi:hypothetical protein